MLLSEHSGSLHSSHQYQCTGSPHSSHQYQQHGSFQHYCSLSAMTSHQYQQYCILLYLTTNILAVSITSVSMFLQSSFIFTSTLTVFNIMARWCNTISYEITSVSTQYILLYVTTNILAVSIHHINTNILAVTSEPTF